MRKSATPTRKEQSQMTYVHSLASGIMGHSRRKSPMVKRDALGRIEEQLPDITDKLAASVAAKIEGADHQSGTYSSTVTCRSPGAHEIATSFLYASILQDEIKKLLKQRSGSSHWRLAVLATPERGYTRDAIVFRLSIQS